MFCTSILLAFVDLTAAAPKLTSDGNDSLGLKPAALTCTMNFSRSVQHTKSTLYSRTSCGLKVTSKTTSMPGATLEAARFPPLISKYGDLGGNTLMRRAT